MLSRSGGQLYEEIWPENMKNIREQSANRIVENKSWIHRTVGQLESACGTMITAMSESKPTSIIANKAVFILCNCSTFPGIFNSQSNSSMSKSATVCLKETNDE